MIRMISGVSRIDGKVRSRSDGPFRADADIEKRLVSLGVAEYVDRVVKDVATPQNGDEDDDTGENSSEGENGSESKFEGENSDDVDMDSEDTPGDDVDIPEYSTESSVTDLRNIAKERGITFPAGTKKEDMVAALDEYYGITDSDDEMPNLDAEAPV